MSSTSAANLVSGIGSGLGSALSYVGRVVTSSTSSASSTIASSHLSKQAFEDKFLSRDLDRLYHAKLRPILDVIDKLRPLLADEKDIKLPTIVVVGDQSSGKSSVLEGLSGVSLPRGSSITTRVPLILRLVNMTPDGLKEGDAVPQPYALISAPSAGVKEEKITNLSDVPNFIDAFTRRLAGNNVGVSNTPISLSVYRALSPDLTLVDLPGITRNPVGDQPADIERQIKSMIESYIRPVESIILAVMPANIDLVTCECRKLARQVDPEGRRTVAVITKMDQCEKGINSKLRSAVDQLGLELGLVGVRNRAQHESDTGTTWEHAREEEIRYFSTHPELSLFLNGGAGASVSASASSADSAAPALSPSSAATVHAASSAAPSPSPSPTPSSSSLIPSKLPSQSGRILLGTSSLASLLMTVQESHIRSILPKVRKQVGDLLVEAKNRQRELPPTWTSERDARLRFDTMLNEFLAKVRSVCDGDRSVFAAHSRSPTSSNSSSSSSTSSSSSSPSSNSSSSSSSSSLSVNEMNLPARLLDQYRQLERELNKMNSPGRYLTAEFARLVEAEMKEGVGTNLPNVPSPAVVTSLIHRELSHTHAPTLSLIEHARISHLTVLQKMCRSVFSSYPALIHALSSQLSDFIQHCNEVTMLRVEECVTQENDVFTVGQWYEDVARKLKSSLMDIRTQIQQGKQKDGLHTLNINELQLVVDSTKFTMAGASELIIDTQINVLAYVARHRSDWLTDSPNLFAISSPDPSPKLPPTHSDTDYSMLGVESVTQN